MPSLVSTLASRGSQRSVVPGTLTSTIMVVQAAVPFKEVSDAERRKAGRAEGPATVLGIGTALPPNVYEQSEYPDFFFAVTNCDHKVELKEKFRRICQKTGIQRRYMYLDKELLQANPGMATYMEPSLNSRQEIAIREVPKLAAQASLKAIKEWGRPKSEITHVVMGTTSGVCMPGAEVSLIKLLGLNPSTRRIMMYQQGCFAGATVTRVAKDLAENNAGARVLAVTSELTVVTFRAPSEEHLDGLVGSALFGDGAAALIVGADPLLGIERPIFELHWSGETLLPDSEGAIEGRLMEAGLVFHLMRDVPTLIAKNIEKVLSGAVTKAGLNHRNNSNVIASAAPAPEAISWDDMFWVVHPGGPAILDQVEKKLKLSSEKLATTRQVLADYGNMSSCSVLFALDHIRHRSKQLGASTSGEGLKWGFLIAFGPGLTFEATLLKSCPI